jgi:hypothetical protein
MPKGPGPYEKNQYIDENGKYRQGPRPPPEPVPKYPKNMYTFPCDPKVAEDGKVFPIVYTGTYPWPGPDRPEDDIKAIAKIGPGGNPYTSDNGEPATEVNGTVYLDQFSDNNASVTYCIMKLPPGKYGLHVQACKPYGVEPDVPVQHIAEIATLEVGSNGIASGQVARVRVPLKGDGIMDQATVFVHAKPEATSEVIAYGVIRVNGHEMKNPHWDSLAPDERKWYEGAALSKVDDHEWSKRASKYSSPLK